MMDKKEFERFRKELSKRFYWCKRESEHYFLTGKGHYYLFRCTHDKKNKNMWIYDRTPDLMKDVHEFYNRNQNESE